MACLSSCGHHSIDRDLTKTGGCYAGDTSDESALAVSGGGYRAMLYHVGSLWRMHELGLLQKMDVISSVSGGSITSAWLGLNWPELKRPDADFETLMATPILEFANTDIDLSSALKGILLPGTVSTYVDKAYNKYLFKDKMLSDLPDASKDGNPRFVILSTNLKTGKLAKFTRDCFYHYPTGRVKYPKIKMSTAVAASSAFPPFLSPVELHFEDGVVDRIGGQGSSFSRYYNNPKIRNHYVLSDGGVYDNLGVEEIDSDSKRSKYRNVFVSDAGAPHQANESVSSFWPLHIISVLSTIDSQVRAQRIKQVFDLVGGTPGAGGAYWQIGIFHKGNEAPEDGSNVFTARLVCLLAETPTRLSSIPRQHQELLVNWGYVSSDTQIRTNFNDVGNVTASRKLPYPSAMKNWEILFSEKLCSSEQYESESG